MTSCWWKRLVNMAIQIRDRQQYPLEQVDSMDTRGIFMSLSIKYCPRLKHAYLRSVHVSPRFIVFWCKRTNDGQHFCVNGRGYNRVEATSQYAFVTRTLFLDKIRLHSELLVWSGPEGTTELCDLLQWYLDSVYMEIPFVLVLCDSIGRRPKEDWRGISTPLDANDTFVTTYTGSHICVANNAANSPCLEHVWLVCYSEAQAQFRCV